jgi:hypothetical protein
MTVILTIMYVAIVFAIYYFDKISSNIVDTTISLVFVGVAVSSYFIYVASLKNTMISLGSIIYLIAVIVVAFLVLFVIAYIQKRWFLTTPIILLTIFWLSAFAFKEYKNSQKITSKNFHIKLPKIYQAIETNNLVEFKKQIELNKQKLKSIDYLLYYQIKPDDNRFEYFEILIDNGLMNTRFFIDFIQEYYTNPKYRLYNIVDRINSSLIRYKNNEDINEIARRLNVEQKSKYLNNILKHLKIHNQGSKKPLYLYDKEKFIIERFTNNLQIFSTLNHKDKMIYIDMFKVIIQNNIYFFGDEDFKEFKEDFLLDLKNNYWSVEKKYLDILITTI